MQTEAELSQSLLEHSGGKSASFVVSGDSPGREEASTLGMQSELTDCLKRDGSVVGLSPDALEAVSVNEH